MADPSFFPGMVEGTGFAIGEAIIAVVIVAIAAAFGMTKDSFLEHIAKRVSGVFRRGEARPAAHSRGRLLGTRILLWLMVTGLTVFLAWKAFIVPLGSVVAEKPLPPGSSRLDVFRALPPTDSPDQANLNLYMVNNGKSVVKGWQHIGVAPLVVGPVSEELFAGFFAMLHAQIALAGPGSPNEIQPGDNNHYWTIFGPTLDDATKAALAANGRIYFLAVQRNVDDTLPKGEFIYSELCEYIWRGQLHVCETGHNKTYVSN